MVRQSKASTLRKKSPKNVTCGFWGFGVLKGTYFKQKSRGSNTLWIFLCLLLFLSLLGRRRHSKGKKKIKQLFSPSPFFPCLHFYSGCKTSPFFSEFLSHHISLSCNYNHRELRELAGPAQGNSQLKVTVSFFLKKPAVWANYKSWLDLNRHFSKEAIH